jgi:sulfide:quinone oxidoreductase
MSNRGGGRRAEGIQFGGLPEGATRVVAAAIIAQLRGGPSPEAYNGAGSCHVEFGHEQVGRVDVTF